MKSLIIGAGLALFVVGYAAAAPQPEAALQTGRLSETVGDRGSKICVLCSETMQGSVDEADLQGFFRLQSRGQEVRAAAVLGDHEFCLTGLRPGTPYRLVLKPGLTAAGGKKLARERTYDFVTADLPADLTLDRGALLPLRPDGNRLNLTYRNLPGVRLILFKIAPEDLIASDIYARLQDRLKVWQIRDLLTEHAVMLGEQTLSLSAAPNEPGIMSLALADLHAPGTGIYLILALDPEYPFNPAALDRQVWEDEFSRHLRLAKTVVVSDLGVTAYQSKDQLRVSVHSLITAEPLSRVKLTLSSRSRETLAQIETDGDGFADFPAPALRGLNGAEPQLLRAERDGDVFMLDLGRSGLYLADNPGRRPLDPEYEVFACTDRGLYRPGETVHYLALLRDPALRAQSPSALLLTVRRPDGSVFATHTLTPAAAGAYAQDLSLPESCARGTWNLELGFDQYRPLTVTSLPVQDFVPPLVSVTAQALPAPLPPAGSLPLTARGEYNYGAPGVGLQGSMSYMIEPDPHPFADFDTYHFGPDEHDYDQLRRRSFSDPLTADERGLLHMTAEVPPADCARRLTYSAYVYDGQGNAASAEETVPVPADRTVIGIKKHPGLAGQLAIIAVDTAGHRQELACAYTLSRREHSYQYVYADNSWQYVATAYLIPVAGGTITAAPDADALISPPAEHGEYQLEVTGAGSRSTWRFYQGYSAGEGELSPDRLLLSADRHSYRPGERVGLEFDSDTDGWANLALGSDRVTSLTAYPVKAGHNRVEFTLDERVPRHVHALITVFAPADQPGPTRAVGMLNLEVERPEQVLTLQADVPSAPLRPGSTLTVPITVPNAARAYYTAALVDDAILQMTHFSPPHPERQLRSPRALGYEVKDLYGYLMRRSAGPGQGYGDEGSGADFAGLSLRRLNQRVVAMFSGISEIRDGAGQVSFPLPDFQGRLRLMVVAWNEQALGGFDQELTVREPTVITVAAPAVIRQGDEITAGITVDNRDENASSYQLSLSCRGSLQCELQKTVAAAPGAGAVNVPFTLRAGAPGEGVIAYHLSCDAASYDGELVTVTAPLTPQVYAQDLRVLGPHERVTVTPRIALTPDARYRFSTGPLPLLDAAAFTERLLGLPGSTEVGEHIAAVLGLSAALRLPGTDPARQRQLTAALQARLRAVEGAVDGAGRIVTGGADEENTVVTTALAGRALLAARDAGMPLNPHVLAALLGYLARQEAEGDTVGSALAQEVSAAAGEANLATMRYHYDHQPPRQPLALTAYARAFAAHGDQERARHALRQAHDALAAVRDLYRALDERQADVLAVCAQLRAYQSAAVSSLTYDTLELIGAALSVNDQDELGFAAELLQADGQRQADLAPHEQALLLHLAARYNLAEAGTGSEIRPGRDGQFTLANPGGQTVFATLSGIGYPRRTPPLPPQHRITTRWILPVGAVIRPPLQLQRQAPILMKIAIAAPRLRGLPTVTRIPLPTGFEFLRVIPPGDMLDQEGDLTYCAATKTDLELRLDSPPQERGRLNFAVLVRPVISGQLAIPALSVQSAGNPGSALVSAPGALTVDR